MMSLHCTARPATDTRQHVEQPDGGKKKERGGPAGPDSTNTHGSHRRRTTETAEDKLHGDTNRVLTNPLRGTDFGLWKRRSSRRLLFWSRSQCHRHRVPVDVKDSGEKKRRDAFSRRQLKGKIV